MTDKKQQKRLAVSNNATTTQEMAHQLGARECQFYDKNNTTIKHQHSQGREYPEGREPHIDVLDVGGCHGNAGEHVTIPRRAEYSCLSGILFFAF